MSQPPSEEQPVPPLTPLDTDEASWGERDGPGTNAPAMLAFAVIGALVILVLILHLTGVVGPTGHR